MVKKYNIKNKKILKKVDQEFFNLYLLYVFANKDYLLSFCKNYALFFDLNVLSDKELLFFIMSRVNFKTKDQINLDKYNLKVPYIFNNLTLLNIDFSNNVYIQICIFIWNYCHGLFLLNMKL